MSAASKRYDMADGGSLLELQAELSKHQARLGKRESPNPSASSKPTKLGFRATVESSKDKQLSQWAKESKELIRSRQQKQKNGAKSVKKRKTDHVVDAVEDRFRLCQPSSDQIAAALERKAKAYDLLKRGKTAGLTEAQIATFSVDFDKKAWDNPKSEDSEDEGQATALPDDELVEYVDEFGRARMMKRSEVPRPGQASPDGPASIGDGTFKAAPENMSNLYYGDQTTFATYEPTEEEIAARHAKVEAAFKPLETHYDPNSEVRERGAAAYAFSADEAKRREQLEDLSALRKETEAERFLATTKQTPAEKRANELAQRKALIEAKRAALLAKRAPAAEASQASAKPARPDAASFLD
ncbi:uncharacterized protein L969DRAFT_44668 [Mixia osmundae IAM 14324]|uniref:Uncharacterized protein n=1 Tax=Mixia osmundae (strain CBS 9802 / IAM 14324 / JCM 22182 / KY 12970) TaxID=764103 RepID=G7DTT6_MIXOS|nr:uncharacterized protein L969DRAFT_44668 [Mixia osmundae IAM 14324]KEI41710.1 hypothetical protein L969DRAFT_44668 [Mixia osmundae IAM 14324]GAA93996.1 hypothetical protein E5Q_00643 [Mixia osmundae IAM 14324]